MNPPKQSLTSITIVLREQTPKIPEITTTIDVNMTAPIQQIVSEICQRYDLEDWNYALYSAFMHIWLQNERPLSDYTMACTQKLFLSTKKPAYFETSTMHSPTGRSVLRAMSSGINALLAKKGSPFRNTFQRHSVYLATILFNADKQILLTKNGQVPTLPIVERDPVNFVKFEESSDDFAWLMKKSMNWTEERRPSDLFTTTTLPGNDILGTAVEMGEDDEDEGGNNVQQSRDQLRNPAPGFRKSIGNALRLMRAELGIKELGFLHDDIVEIPEQKIKFIITYNFVPKSLLQTIASEYIQRGILKWSLAEKLDKLYTQSTVADIWRKPYRFYSSRKFKTGGGLYLGLFYAESKVNGINIFLPRGRKNFLPTVRIRQECDMTDIEWSWVRSIACCDKESSTKSQPRTPSEEQPKLSAAKHTRLNSKGSDYNVEDFKQSFQRAFDMLQERTQLSFQNNDIFSEGTVLITSNTANRDTVAVISEESQINSATLDLHSSELENEDGSMLYTHPNIRIIWIVKPMRNLITGTDNVRFNEKDYCFYPFHIFDILHHSLYNSAVYAPLRRIMLALQESYTSIREDLEEASASSLEKLFSHDPLDGFASQKSVIIKQYQEQLHREQLQHGLLTPPRTPELVSSLLPSSSPLTDVTVSAEPKTLDESLAIISDEMQVVTSEWSSMSYTHHLMQFDRQRNFRQTGLHGAGKWSSWKLEEVLAMIHKSHTRIMKEIKAVTMQQETERAKIGLEKKMVQLAEKDISKLKVSKDKESNRFSSFGLTRR